jgi:hypothetical protein
MTFVNVLATRSDASPLFFFVVIIGVIIAMACNAARKNRMRAALQRVAARVGGVVEEGGVFSRTRMRFQIGGRAAWIEVHAGSKNNPAYTQVSVDVRGRSRGSLHILPEGIGQSFLKMFGAQDLEIGNAAFDASFVIKANPESIARNVFSSDRQRAVIAAVSRIQNLGDPTIDLDVNQLCVRVRAYVAEEGGLLQLLKTTEEFVGFLFGSSSDPGIQIGKVRVLSGGECPVCGTAMADQVVRCEACQTPHHGECWKYVGRCSTYGCRGKRAA